MENNFETVVRELLETITDYENIELTKDEEIILIQRVNNNLGDYIDVTDENVESEINIYLTELGYLYHEEDNLWMKEKFNELDSLVNKDREEVAKFFEMSLAELLKEDQNENMRFFPSYKEMFYWFYEDSDVRSLIDCLYKGSEIDKKQYIILKNGSVVFMYK